MNASLIFNAKAQLGEGAIWNSIDSKLYWVDIEARYFHMYDPATAENRSYQPAKGLGRLFRLGITLFYWH